MQKIEIKRSGRLEDSAVPVRNVKQALEHILPLFPREDACREQCHALFLDAKNRVVGTFLVSAGGIRQTPVDCKAICAAALGCLAEGVILAHNHPSGDPAPSASDVDMTGRLRKALATIDIKLIDHVILGEKEYFSFTEEKKYPLGVRPSIFDQFGDLNEAYVDAQRKMQSCARKIIAAFVEKHGVPDHSGHLSVDIRSFFLTDDDDERNDRINVLVPDNDDYCDYSDELLHTIDVCPTQECPENPEGKSVFVNDENLFYWENFTIIPEVVLMCRDIEDDIAEGKASFEDGTLRYAEDNE